MAQGTKRYFDEAQDLLRGKSPEDYGPEFAAIMRSKLGPRGQGLASPEKLGLMGLIGDPRFSYNIAGRNYVARGSKDKEKLAERILQDFLPFVEPDDFKEIKEGKRIFGVGRHANSATYAHELRHENVRNESRNRIHDLVYGSTSLPAYKANLNNVYGYLTNFDFKKQNIPIEEKEKEVLRLLEGQIKQERVDVGVGFLNGLMSLDFLNKNIELNKSGAVGGFLDGKKLPNAVIQHRAKMPFLNFVGRLGSSESKEESKRKAVGGNVERVYYDRKLI